MNAEETLKAGHRKTIIRLNVDELIKDKLRSLKKDFNTSGTYRRTNEEIEFEINGHISKVINSNQ
jgi:hypothetical protein